MGVVVRKPAYEPSLRVQVGLHVWPMPYTNNNGVEMTVNEVCFFYAVNGYGNDIRLTDDIKVSVQLVCGIDGVGPVPTQFPTEDNLPEWVRELAMANLPVITWTQPEVEVG